MSSSTRDSAPHRPGPVPLTSLQPGDRGRLHDSVLDASDQQMLMALGLAPKSRLRLCKAGNPWIVQVRSTRIGLADAVARNLMVLREDA